MIPLANTAAQKRASCMTVPHFVLMAVTFSYVFINLVMPELKHLSIAFTIGLFLFYTWRRIFMIVITAVIAFALVSVFPFLAPVAFILMLVIFFMRLGYIVNNWRAVLTGFYMYGIAVGFALWHWPFMSEALAASIAAAVTLLFHLLMLWLYRHGYTMQRAMPVMGVAPLLILLLCLPFIKAFDGFDTGADTVDTGTDTIDAADVAHHGGMDAVHHGAAADSGTHAAADAVDVHHTHDYYRTGADGVVQHVRGYTATNPDGIVDNNFSAHGESFTDSTAPSATGSDAVVHSPSSASSAAADAFAGADAGRTEKKRKEQPNN